jgi:hypothetical protein
MRTDYRYEVIEGWEQLPVGWTHKDVVGVGVDSRDRVYLLTRSDPRVIVYEPDGTFVASWAEGTFTNRTHGIRIGPDDSVWCVDDGDHTVRKFAPTGELLMTIGTAGVHSDTGYVRDMPGADLWDRLRTITHGGGPFNRPTCVEIAPDGELYVTDGYGNCRVHRFTAEGKLIQSWGEPGSGPGQFYLPHDVCVTQDDRLLVCDRENDRIQIFTRDGTYLNEWTHLHRPTAVRQVKDGTLYVSELSRRKGMPSFRLGAAQETRAGSVAILEPDGTVIHRWGGPDMAAPGNFWAPHCLCVDSKSDVYVGEVTYTDWVSQGFAPEDSHMFQKFARK